MATKPPTEDDAFAAAFADFSTPGEGAPSATATPPAVDPPAGDPPADPPAADPPAADPPAADPPAADPPASDPPAAVPADPPAAADPPAPPAAPAPKTAEDILAGLADAIARRPADPAPAPAAPAAEAPVAEPPPYNEEETAFLTDYEKEWGDVSKGEALKRRTEYKQLLGYIFDQVKTFVEPFRETTELLAERTHATDVRAAVPDYSENLRTEVEDWAKTQPEYLQAAYNQVITKGSVDEVKDLVARYRAATGKATGVAPTTSPPKPVDNELSGAAKKAAEALAPVDVKRSGVQQPEDPSSFDDAWKQAATDMV